MLMLIINFSKLIETKNDSKYLIEYLEKVVIPLVLILPKMSGYVKTFKDKTNKFMSFGIDDDNLLEKYKTISSRIEEKILSKY